MTVSRPVLPAAQPQRTAAGLQRRGADALGNAHDEPHVPQLRDVLEHDGPPPREAGRVEQVRDVAACAAAGARG